MTMGKKWLVLSDDDFGHSIELSRSCDLLDSYGEAEYSAENSVKGGSRLTYIFELKEVYVPAGGRMIPVHQVELVDTKQALLGGFEGVGYGGTD